jgi:plasmid stabilization system protein ParE
MLAWMAEEHPLAAQAWIKRLEAAGDQLGRFPYSGHILPEVPRLATRETLVDPYRLIYFVGDEQVTVINVCHTRESLAEYPDELEAAMDDG